MKLSNNKIKQINEYLSTKPVIKAYLFGSFAEGKANKQSDVDILLEMDYSVQIGLTFLDIKTSLEKILNKQVDLVTEKALSKELLPYVEKQKKLIYERCEHNYPIIQ